jgi:hypothetical protein
MLRKSANFDLNVQPIIEESVAEAASGNVSFLIESSGHGGQSLGSLRDRLATAVAYRMLWNQ